MDQKKPFFSIIIPTYNRPNQLAACLQSLVKLDYPANRFEVIAVDDGGSVLLEPVVATVRNQLDIKLIAQTNAGPASARNTGAANAKGTHLAFIDDDCMASSSWLKGLANALATNPDGLVGGHTINALPENTFSTASQALISYLYAYYNNKLDQARFFASNNIALSAKLFHKIEGFDASSFPVAAEDRELCDRLLYHGYRMTYIADAVVYHAHHLGLNSFLSQHFNYGRGAFWFHRLHALRGQGNIKLEPPSFYINLLLYPFSESGVWPGLSIAVLLVIAQIANVVGFFWEAGYHGIRSIRNHI